MYTILSTIYYKVVLTKQEKTIEIAYFSSICKISIVLYKTHEIRCIYLFLHFVSHVFAMAN